MEELLQSLIQQNEYILAALERMADKLDVLDDIRDRLDSLDTVASTMERLSTSLESDVSDIKFNISSIHDELQWHKDLSATAQLIKAIDDVAEAVRAQ